MRLILTFIGTGLLFFSVNAFSQDSEYLHQTNLSARIMGMGGAYTAVADDYLALYYNPAGLARRENFELNLGFQAMYTPSIINFVTDMSNAGSNPTNLQTVLTNYVGSHFGARIGLGGTYVRPHWGLGINPVDMTVEVDVDASSGYSASVLAYQDTTIQFGYAWNINEDKTFNIGIAPKMVYRGYFAESLSIFQLETNSNLYQPTNMTEGATPDFDLGLLYTFKVPEDGWLSWLKYAKPTIGFAVRNVLNLGMISDWHLYNASSSLAMAPLERRFDVGTRFDLPDFWVFHPRFMFDMRDMGTRYASFIKCLHTGVEVLWKAFSWLNGAYRVGVSEGYLTAGISAQLSVFMIDLAAYSEDIGTNGTPRQSQRYIAKLSLDF